MDGSIMIGCDCQNRSKDVPLNDMHGIMHWEQVYAFEDKPDRSFHCFIFECDRCGVRVRAVIEVDTEGDQ